MPESIEKWIDEIANRLELEISDHCRGQLIGFIDLLKCWNNRFNLTRVTDDEGIAIRHLLDSLTLLPYLDQLENTLTSGKKPSLVDVGSGAGFPGIPLKIMRPQWSLLLIDSLAKRIRFLDEVIDTLRLQNVATWHGRAEDAGRTDEWREQFDGAVARAVAPLSVLAEYCLPLVRPGGVFIAMKGKTETEWPIAKRAVSLLGGQLERCDTMLLPGTDMNRTILTFRKKNHTPDTYPRQAGRPEKRPL